MRDVQVTLSSQQQLNVKLQIWDTAGQEQWSHTMGGTYYRGPDACVLVYDVCSQQSLENLKRWQADFMKYYINADQVLFVFAGNKLDKKSSQQISFMKAQ